MTTTPSLNSGKDRAADQITIDVLCEDEQWEKEIPDVTKHIKKIVTHTLSFTGLNQQSLEICIVLANDVFIQDLNHRFRHKDKPTNVLSFPSMDIDPDTTEEFVKSIGAHDIPMHLGDVTLAFETILHEAQQQEKSFQDHLSHLLIHGILHLLGYDHIEEEDAQKMEKFEITILEAIGIENPYATTANE